MELQLCIIVESFYSQVRNTFPHISLHDLPCRETCYDFPEALVGSFLLGSSRNPGFKHISVFCHNLIAYCTFSLSTTKYTWSRNDVGSSRSTLLIKIFQVGFTFSVSPAILISSTYTDKNSPFARLTNKHSQFKTFPNRVPIELSQIAFPTIVLPETGSSISDHDFGHLCFGSRIQISGHSDSGFFNIFDASSILTWVQADTASAA